MRSLNKEQSKRISFLLTFAIFCIGNSINLPPNSNLVIHLPFEDSIEDFSSNKNHGLLMGKGHPIFKEGAVGKGIEYNIGFPFGAFEANYIKILKSESTTIGEEFTFSIWAKKYSNLSQTGRDCSGTIIAEMLRANLISLGGNWEKGINIMYNYKELYVANGPSGVPGKTIASIIVDLDQWGHYVVTQDKLGVRVYVNGTKIQELETLDINTANTRDLYLGSENGAGSCAPTWYPLDGMFDDFRMYNKSITDQEVLALFELRNDNISPVNNELTECFSSLEKSSVVVNGYIIDSEVRLKVNFLKTCVEKFNLTAFIGSKESPPLHKLNLESSSNKSFILTSFNQNEIEKFKCNRSIDEYFLTDNCTIYLKFESGLEVSYLLSIDLIIQTNLLFNTTTLWKNTIKEEKLGGTVIKGETKFFEWFTVKNDEEMGYNSILTVIDTLVISLKRRKSFSKSPLLTPLLLRATGGNSDDHISFDIGADINLISKSDESWNFSINLQKFSGKSYIELEFKIQFSNNESRFLQFNSPEKSEVVDDSLLMKFYVSNPSAGESSNINYYYLYYLMLIPAVLIIAITLLKVNKLRKDRKQREESRMGEKYQMTLEKEPTKKN